VSESRAESEDAGGGRRAHGVVGHGVMGVVRGGVQAVRRVVAHDDPGRGHVGQEGGRGRVEVHAASGRPQGVVGGRRKVGQPRRVAVGRDGRDSGRGAAVVDAAGRRGGRDHGGRHGRAGRRRGHVVVVREAEQLLDGERRALRHAGGRGAEYAGGRNVDRGRAALCVQHLRSQGRQPAGRSCPPGCISLDALLSLLCLLRRSRLLRLAARSRLARQPPL